MYGATNLDVDSLNSFTPSSRSLNPFTPSSRSLNPFTPSSRLSAAYRGALHDHDDRSLRL
jgi:hypothetical protein